MDLTQQEILSEEEVVCATASAPGQTHTHAEDSADDDTAGQFGWGAMIS